MGGLGLDLNPPPTVGVGGFGCRLTYSTCCVLGENLGEVHILGQRGMEFTL